MKKTKIISISFLSIYILISSCSQLLYGQDSLKTEMLNMETLKRHVYSLAADSMMGRKTGQFGQRKAAIYCKTEMEKLGLLPLFSIDSGVSFVQHYTFDLVTPSGFMKMPPQLRFMNDVKVPVLNYSESNSTSIKGQNIGSWIIGNDKKEEFIVVSAHYDHLGRNGRSTFHGADDNASGTATVLAVAEKFRSKINQGLKPRRSIIFVLFSGEEDGLLGSKYYVSSPPFPVEHIVCDINVDMVGRVDREHRKKRDYVYLIDGFDFPEIRKILEEVNEKKVGLKIDQTHNSKDDPNQYYYRSDHYNFARKGVPVLFLMDGEHPDYHQPSDTADKIEYDILQKRATLIFETAWELANRDKI